VYARYTVPGAARRCEPNEEGGTSDETGQSEQEQQQQQAYRWRDPISELVSFAGGIFRDFAAVAAGLTLAHPHGPIEGQVNRLKMLKRQTYGRANFDLLRRRVLYHTSRE
jgi:transposase